MRTAWVPGLVFLLAACGQQPAAAPQADGQDRIACALAGAAQYRQGCAVERHREDGRLVLVVHHPDGGFRRFQVVTDGRGLLEADGAEALRSRLSGSMLEVAVGRDRYRFPATLKEGLARE